MQCSTTLTAIGAYATSGAGQCQSIPSLARYRPLAKPLRPIKDQDIARRCWCASDRRSDASTAFVQLRRPARTRAGCIRVRIDDRFSHPVGHPSCQSFPMVVTAVYPSGRRSNRWTDPIEVNMSNNPAAVPSIVFACFGLAVFTNLRASLRFSVGRRPRSEFRGPCRQTTFCCRQDRQRPPSIFGCVAKRACGKGLRLEQSGELSKRALENIKDFEAIN